MVMPYRPSAPTYGTPSALPSAAASAPSTGYKPPTSVPSIAPASTGTPWISPAMPSAPMPSKTFDATGGYSTPTRSVPMLPGMSQPAGTPAPLASGGSSLTSGMGMNEATGQQYGQQYTPPKTFDATGGYSIPSTGGGQFGLPGPTGGVTPPAYAGSGADQTYGAYQGMPPTGGGGQFGLPGATGAPTAYGGSGGVIASGGAPSAGGGQFGLPGQNGFPPPPVVQPPIPSVQPGGNPYPGQQQQAPIADWQAQYGQLSNQQAQQMSDQANNARNLAAIGQYKNITAGDNGTYYGTDYYGQRQQLTGNQAMTSGSASANDLYQQQLAYADQTRRMGQMLRQSQSRYLGGYDPNMLRGNLAGYG